jgi:hypothetical protein
LFLAMARTAGRLPLTVALAFSAHVGALAMLGRPPGESRRLLAAEEPSTVDVEPAEPPREAPAGETIPGPRGAIREIAAPEHGSGRPVSRPTDGPSSKPAPSPSASPGAPPAAATAGTVVAAAPEATADAVVTGTAPVYAGGYSGGTSALAVYVPSAAVDGLLDGAGTGGRGGGAGRDRSAPARLGGNVDWSARCPWPTDQPGDHAIVHLVATVAEDGRFLQGRVIDEAGPGFGVAALRCAHDWQYVPARDAYGRPASGRTGPFRVVFERTTIAGR